MNTPSRRERPTTRALLSVTLMFGAALAAFAAGRASGGPEAKPSRPGWESVASLDESLRSIAGSLARIATSPETARAMQAIQAAPAAGRPALAAKAIEGMAAAAASGSSAPRAFRVTSTGADGVRVLAESPAPTAEKVEHWGDPHENLNFTLQAGELTLTIRAPFPPAATPTQPTKPK